MMAAEKVEQIEEKLTKQDILDSEQIDQCFSTLKQIITAADKNENNLTRTESESIYADYADDQEKFYASDPTEESPTNSVKWTIRVRAFKCVHRIFNLLLVSNKSAVLKILSDLVRLSFVAVTSPYDDLKIQGFQMFRELINQFASVEEKELPGHSILEQYKTQVLTALKPAFNLDAPPYITAIACQVSSRWICRGLERNPTGLKRAYQLMEPSIEKLETQSVNPNSLLYKEIELEQERLNILGSWAQLYEASEQNKLLSDLISERVESLVDKWWEALKDYALLIMPSPKKVTVSYENEHVCTREVALELFTPIWPRLTLALTLWLCTSPEKSPHKKDKPVRFLCGLIMHDLCKVAQSDSVTDSLSEATIIALKSLSSLMSGETTREVLMNEISICSEFYTALVRMSVRLIHLKRTHQLLLKSTSSQIFKLFLSKLEENDKVMQYSLAQQMGKFQIRVELSEANKQILFANLIETVKYKPLVLIGDHRLLDAFTDIVNRTFSQESNHTTILFALDALQNLNETRATADIILKRVSSAKLSLLLKLLNSRHDDESMILLDAIIKSLKVDLELLDGFEREKMLADLIKTLLTNFDSSKCGNDSVKHITQILKDLEKNFKEEFSSLKKSELNTMIDNALKPMTKDENKFRIAKKSGSVKKPASTIVLKSDFSNFYSKK